MTGHKRMPSRVACERFGVNPSTLRNWIANPAVPVHSYGVSVHLRQSIVDPEEIRAWLDPNRVKPTPRHRPRCRQGGCRRWQVEGMPTCTEHAGRPA